MDRTESNCATMAESAKMPSSDDDFEFVDKEDREPDSDDEVEQEEEEQEEEETVMEEEEEEAEEESGPTWEEAKEQGNERYIAIVEDRFVASFLNIVTFLFASCCVVDVLLIRRRRRSSLLF